MGPKATSSSSNRKGLKKGEGVGQPTVPGPSTLDYGDDHYEEYSFAQPNTQVTTHTVYMNSYSAFDQYKLIKNGLPDDIAPLDLPEFGVRLDDRLSGLLSLVLTNREAANKHDGEFGRNGMIRARRCPLGAPMLVKVKEGELDLNKEPADVAGFYYGRQHGLHLLCGKEGLDADMYRVRPSFEEEFSCKIGFLKQDLAVNQADPFGTAITIKQGRRGMTKSAFKEWYEGWQDRVVDQVAEDEGEEGEEGEEGDEGDEGNEGDEGDEYDNDKDHDGNDKN